MTNVVTVNNMRRWEINKISVITSSWIKEYELWKQDIEEIIDKSIEFESSIYSIYEIIDSRCNIVARIENCSVIIEYERFNNL